MLIAQTTIPFGLLGILIVVGFLIWLAHSRSPSLTRICPYCKKRLRGDASVCPHCQRESAAWIEHEGYWWRQDQAGQWEYLRADGSLRPDGGRWMKAHDASRRTWPTADEVRAEGRSPDTGLPYFDEDSATTREP